ncbi:MAG: RnfABCDGE type electron transport complex subunit G [Muribaculaceae bacterium]|nr:RnfABCDGE type electron transport complex subunit G [Muribaculaceae bacterium]
MVLSLGLITIVAGTLLALVYNTTKEPIDQAKLEKQTQAISEVAPEFNNQPTTEEVKFVIDGDTVNVYPAKKDGQLVGAAVKSWTKKAFSGSFSVMYGFDTDGNVTGYAVLAHEETPGLGAKMDIWFKDPVNTERSVIGLNPDVNNMTVSKDGGEVDAITAATISSRAFLDALSRAHNAFKQYKEQN